MKNYTITVNGNVYDVTVEETGSTPSTASAPRRAAAPAAAAPKAAAPAGADEVRPELPERYLSSRLRLAM